ncbi:MAG TPA: hypothetical protein PLC40_17935, partial [Candidatus Hydrogenedentes bacterium]|nr:hypothetical protein [Candidatus Hydrogenedentota bacterium]
MNLYYKYVPLILAFSGVVLSGYDASGEEAAQAPVRDLQTNRRNFDLGLSALIKLRDTRAAEAVADTAESAGAAASGEDAEKAASPVHGQPILKYRKLPLRTGSVRAPRPGRPSANPLEQLDRRALQDAITRPLEFGAPSLGFQPPDWTEPLRDIEADSMVTDLSTGETLLKDNVRLRLGTMLFRSDAFQYMEEAGHYTATGHVRVQQHESLLMADTLTYTAPEPEVIERTFVLEPGPDEQRFAKRRLSMGRLLAENLHVIEPTR